MVDKYLLDIVGKDNEEILKELYESYNESKHKKIFAELIEDLIEKQIFRIKSFLYQDTIDAKAVKNSIKGLENLVDLHIYVKNTYIKER
jgi:hypothetical protein